MGRDEKCNICGNTEYCGVEYDWCSNNHYDGVSEWRCLKCNTRYGRWTDKILEENEEEKVFGDKRN